MRKKIIFGLLLITTIIVSGCGSERRKSMASGHSCVDCGAEAMHFAGTGWVESKNSYATLYLCDTCYHTRFDEVPKVNGDFTDPDNFGKVVK